jgi:hypothetical protein
MFSLGPLWRQQEHRRRSWLGSRSRPCGEGWNERLRGRSAVADRGMRADSAIQLGAVTPTELKSRKSAKCFTPDIPRPGALSVSTKPSRRPTAFFFAAPWMER